MGIGNWSRQPWSSPDSTLRLQVTFRDALMLIVGCGLIMHQLARRYEPQTPSQMIALTFAPPAILTVFLLDSNLSSTSSSLPLSAFPLRLSLTFIFASSTYAVTILLSILVYRLSPWHPLASYPGPLTLRISKLAIVWRTRRGDMHRYIRALHDQYGDYIRVGPNEISIRNIEAIVPILGSAGLPKGPSWDGRSAAAPLPEQRSITALREWRHHADRRKLWSKGFSSSALENYEPIIIRRGKQLVKGLEVRKDRVDIAAWAGYFTFDFMGDMAFGGGFELLRDGSDTEGIWTLLREAMPYAFIIYTFRGTVVTNLDRTLPTYPPLSPDCRTIQRMSQVPWAALLLNRFGPKNQKNQKLRAFATKWAKKRMSEGSSSRDLFYHLYEVDNALSNHSIARMPSEAVTAIVAGSDTTMTALSNIYYFLCEYPDCMTRLQAEIELWFPDFEEPFNSARLSHMPVLNAIINEALRLQPPVPSGVERSVAPGSGVKVIGSQCIPEGTQVSIHTYALQRDPRYFFPHPEEFWPDRWLFDSERQFPARFFGSNPSPSAINASVILHQTAFTPFSFGPADCVGRYLAILEIRMIVSLIAQKFEMRFAKGYERQRWLAEQEDWFLTKVGKLEVELTPRF